MQIKDSPVIKKLIAIIPFVIAAALAITAVFATNKRIDDTKNYFEEYISALTKLDGYLTEVVKANDQTSAAKSRRSDALKEIETLRKTADYFENLKTPKCLRDDHEELMKTISKEHMYINTVENVFNSSSSGQMKKALSEMSDFVTYQSSNDGFPMSLAKFIAAVDREREHARKSKRGVFVWI